MLLLSEFSMDNAYEQRDLLVLWHDLSKAFVIGFCLTLFLRILARISVR